MNRKTFKTSRIASAMLLISVFTAAFIWNSSLAREDTSRRSANLKTGKASAAKFGETIVRVTNPSPALVNFQNGAVVETDFAGENNASSLLEDGQPTAFAAEDLDQDGFKDLLVGYRSGGGGTLSIQRGNKEAFQPEDPEVLEGIRNSRFPAPFLAKTEAFALPEAVDFVGTGDFNRDGKPDAVAAAKGGTAFYLLEGGRGKRGFGAPQRIEINGSITALTIGDLRNQQLGANVFVGVTDAGTGSGRILIYDFINPEAFPEVRTIELPSFATTIVTAHLDTDSVADLAISTNGGEVFVLHNSVNERDGIKIAATNQQSLEKLNFGIAAETLTAGNFLADLDAKKELAVLTKDGAIRILARGDLERRPMTEAELKRREEVMENGNGADVRRWEAEQTEAALLRRSAQSHKWRAAVAAEVRQDSLAQNFSAGSAKLIAEQMLNGAGDDLMVVDKANRKTIVLPLDDNPNIPQQLAAQALTLDSEKELIDALPIRTSVMAHKGMVMLHADATAPVSALVAAPAVGFVVNTTTDAQDANIGNGVCETATAGQCSLRAAITEANQTPAADSITFSVNGTFTMSLTGGNNDNNASGDFDIREDLTITGNGDSNTILSMGASITQRIFDIKVPQSGSGANNTSIISLTIQGGNRVTGLGDGFGGGIKFDGFNITNSTPTGSLGLSGVKVQNNQADQDGGGIWATAGATTITNSTITNNTAMDGDGGGVNYGVGAGIAVYEAPLTMNNSTVSNNQALNDNVAHPTTFFGRAGGVLTRGASNPVHTITNSTITGNDSESPGGGIAMESPTTVSGGSITGNCAGCNGSPAAPERGDGGGVWSYISPTFAAAGDNNLSGVTITNNEAKGDGGGAYLDLDVLIISNSSLGAAGAGNIAAGGGGGVAANRAIGGTGDGGGTLTLNNNTTVRGNTTPGNGGGVLNGGGPNNEGRTVVINGGASVGGTIAGQGNSAANGDGIANLNGSLTMTGGSVRNNDGDGVYTAGGTTTLDGVTISGNTGNGVNQTSGTTNFANTLAITNNLALGGGTLNSQASIVNLTGNFSQSGGTFNGNTATYNLTGNFSFTGSTFNGNTGTFNFNGGSAQSITGSVTFNNLTINNGSGVNLNSNETVGGTLSLTNGVLGVGSNTLTLNSTVSFTNGSISSNPNGTVNYNQGTNGQAVAPGNYGNLTFSNFNKTLPAVNINIAGTFSSGTASGHTVTGNTITLNGSAAQTIPAFTFNNLTLNNSEGATLVGNATVGGALTLTSGTLNVSTFLLTLNSTATQTGGAFSSGATGTVNYNQSSVGQNVLTGNYGNLTFSNSNKLLPSSGTIGVAGTFTPGTATGHTITGSTFNFNGSAGQTIPAFNYFNLTSSNAGARTLASSGTIGVAGAFTPGTNVYTVTGSTFNFNGAGAQTISAFNYNNLTVSGNRGDANVTFASGTIGVANVFNPSVSFAIFVRTGNTFNFNGAGAQTIPQFAYNNLSTAGGGTKTLGGTVDVLADLLIGAGTTLDVSASNFPLNVYGNFTNNGTFNARTGTVTFTGSAAQNVSGSSATTFSGLSINNAAGVTFTSNATVAGALTLTNGNVTMSGSTLTLSGTYTRNSGHVIGNVLRNLTSGAFTYPVGTANGYSPVTFNVTAGGGNMTVRAVQGAQPNVTAATSLQRYWSLTGTGMTADITFNYLDGDVPGGVLESDYRITRITPPSTQTVLGSASNINATNNTATINGVTEFSDWTLTERFSVDGTVYYGIPAGQTTKKVKNVLLTVTVGTSTSATTNTTGVYLIDNLTPDINHTVTPTKSGDVKNISGIDATLVLRHAAANGAGPNALSANQQIAADTDGNGKITGIDATRILRYSAAMGPTPDTGQVGNWKFVLPSKTYNPLSTTLSNQNYEAILVGDVDGDWEPPQMLNASNKAVKQVEQTAVFTNGDSINVAPEAPSFVREQQEFMDKSGKRMESTEVQLVLPKNSSAPAGSVALIPIWLDNHSNKQFSAFSFAVRFDPTVLQPEQTAIETNNSLIGNGFMVVSDTATAGRVGVAAVSLKKPAAGSGTLVYLRFRVLASNRDLTSALTIETASESGGTFEDNLGNKLSSATANGSFSRLG